MTIVRSCPIARVTFNPYTGYYGFAVHLEGRPVHQAVDTFTSLEGAKRWVDP